MLDGRSRARYPMWPAARGGRRARPPRRDALRREREAQRYMIQVPANAPLARQLVVGNQVARLSVGWWAAVASCTYVKSYSGSAAAWSCLLSLPSLPLPGAPVSSVLDGFAPPSGSGSGVKLTKDAVLGMRPRQGYWRAVVLGLHSPVWPVEQQGWVFGVLRSGFAVRRSRVRVCQTRCPS